MPITQEPIDWSGTAAWIALAISIITPTITTIFNNIHLRKLKKIDIIENRRSELYLKRSEVFEDFFRQSASQIHSVGGNIFDYKRSVNNLFLYIPESYWSELEELNSMILAKNHDSINKLYIPFTEKLALLLQEQQRLVHKKHSK